MQSVDRVLKIIEAVVNAEDGLGVIEASEFVDLPPSTTHRILTALVKQSYLSQDKVNKKYYPGKMLFAISGKLVRDNSLATLGRPFLVDLSDETGETVHFCILEDYKTYLIDKVRSNKNLTHTSNMGFKDEPYLTSFGKVLLANMSDEQIEKYIETSTFIRRTPNTIIDKSELKKELRSIKREGYAVDNEEAEEGLYCIATPVYDSNGSVAAAISISGPTFRVKEDFDKNLECLKKASKNMSAALGWKFLNKYR